jgi:hypothetical protein
MFEILSGRVMMVSAGTVAAGSAKFYDVATNTFSGNNVGVTNLPTAATDTAMVCLDEQHIPAGATSSTGLLGAITAQASGTSTIQSATTQGDTSVLSNEYRNFMIRIVTDTTNKTAIGQRRLIASHTAGDAPTYTIVGQWTVTPSSTCTFVIENSDYMLYTTGGQTNIYCYHPYGVVGGQAMNTWNTSTIAARGTAPGAGTMIFQPFGITLANLGSATVRNIRHSYIFSFRGGANILDVLDIAGGATGSWTNGVAAGAVGAATGLGNFPATALSAGCAGEYASQDTGKYFYFQLAGTQYIYRFDAFSRQTTPWAYLQYADASVAVGARIATTCFVDGSTRVPFVVMLWNTAVNMSASLISR